MAVSEQGKKHFENVDKGFEQVAEILNTLFLGSEPGSKVGPSPGILQFIPALGMMKGVPKELRDWYRNQRKQIATKPPKEQFRDFLNPQQFEAMAKYLKGAFFHGTEDPATLERTRKFSNEKVGGTGGMRFGEPGGVSVSGSPAVASNFGHTFRVGLNLNPNDVAPVMSHQGKEAILDAYLDSIKKTIITQESLQDANQHGRSVADEMLRRGISSASIEDLLPLLKEKYKYYYGSFVPEQFWRDASSILGDKNTQMFNKNMSNFLRQNREIEGLLYNPNRYSEAELRVLNPANVTPLDKRGTAKYNTFQIPQKYRDLKEDLIGSFSNEFRGFPNSLSEYYSVDPKLDNLNAHPVKGPVTVPGENIPGSHKLKDWIDTVKNPKTGVHEPVSPNTTYENVPYKTDIFSLSDDELIKHYKNAFNNKNIHQGFYDSLFPNSGKSVTSTTDLTDEDYNKFIKLFQKAFDLYWKK